MKAAPSLKISSEITVFRLPSRAPRVARGSPSDSRSPFRRARSFFKPDNRLKDAGDGFHGFEPSEAQTPKIKKGLQA
jgi:hypothetical protein